MDRNILAIESSSESCSIALSHDSRVHFKYSEEPRGHAKNILPMIEELLSEAGLKTTDLDAIAVTNGPGAFTSVRIGVAVCQGLAAALKCPVISLSSLAVLAYGAMKSSSKRQALVALDARMNEVYYGAYALDDEGLPYALRSDVVAAPLDLDVPEITKGCVAAGMGWLAYREQMKERFTKIEYQWLDQNFPNARDLLEIAQIYYSKQKWHDVSQLVPVYLRDQVVHS